MFDVGDLPVLTFGNCVLKTGVIKWPPKLRRPYVFNVFKIQKHDFLRFLSCCTRFLQRCQALKQAHTVGLPDCLKCEVAYCGMSNFTNHQVIKKQKTIYNKHQNTIREIDWGLSSSHSCVVYKINCK